VDAQHAVPVRVDLDGHPRPADGTGLDQVRALAQQTHLEQPRDLPVHRGVAQLGRNHQLVAEDEPSAAGGVEYRG
jgi:hypothetical protein